MKSRWTLLYTSLILIITMMILCGLQTTFWFNIAGGLAAPFLGLNLIVYVMLYNRTYPAFFYIYALGFVATAFTIIPLKMIWLTFLILFALVYNIKKRIFWNGSGYFTIMCAVAILAFHIIGFTLSHFIEKNPSSLEIWSRLLQIILTPLFAPPIYWVLSRFFKASQDELVHETGGLDL